MKDWTVFLALLALVVAVISIDIAQYNAMSKLSDRVSRVEATQHTFMNFLKSPLTDAEETAILKERAKAFVRSEE